MSSSSSDNHQLSGLVELSAALVSRRRRAWHHLGNPKTRLALFLALSLKRFFFSLSLSLSLASSLAFFGSFLLPRRVGFGDALVPGFDLARTENYLILETLKLASTSCLLSLLLWKFLASSASWVSCCSSQLMILLGLRIAGE